nr:probable asparagine--tRNA ligase, mitochondrial [Parasteatoda tepidariorum]
MTVRMLQKCLTLQRRFCTIPLPLTVKEALSIKPINKTVLVRGWVQSVRNHKGLYFVDLVDGTCFGRLQIVLDAQEHSIPPKYGSSIKVEGSVVKSLHKGQEVELHANSWKTYGECAEDYPFVYHQKFSQEFIRQYLHLRPKTRKFSSILRIRNNASIAVQNFFQKEGFCFIHTPIITQNDCEGAGEVFSIEVRDKDKLHKENSVEFNNQSNALNDHLKLEKSPPISSKINNEEEFFGSPTYLTVSGQLHLEAMVSALSRVYTFGPTFRAEGSQTRLHASEFQMIEAEIAFVETINDVLQVAEKCIKYVTESLLESCKDEIIFTSENNKDHQDYINRIVSKDFVHLSYSEAIIILENNRKRLKVPIKYGDDIGTDHKQFLVKHCNNTPVFVSMFPSSIKPFYMKTDERNLAYCFDLFAPFGGEVCGGSLREDNYDLLKEKFSFEENPSLSWYLDLRKYGSVPHGGFGIGFDRYLQCVLGIPNIRDVIPFPRRKFDCKC